MFREFETVVLAQAVPGSAIGAGALGTIVDVLSRPQLAYLVEFCNDEGETLDTLALMPDQLARL